MLSKWDWLSEGPELQEQLILLQWPKIIDLLLLCYVSLLVLSYILQKTIAY